LTSVLAYLTIQLEIYGFFGHLLAGQMNATFGLDAPWWVWSLIAWALVLPALAALALTLPSRPCASSGFSRSSTDDDNRSVVSWGG
jgi:hypothetical protein